LKSLLGNHFLELWRPRGISEVLPITISIEILVWKLVSGALEAQRLDTHWGISSGRTLCCGKYAVYSREVF
jgi:hypothetical protein